MKLLIDTREQNPLKFDMLPNIEFTETRTLNIGDYCVEYKNGWVPGVVFERKSIGDLFGTMGKGYERFKREINRAKDQQIDIILIIEGSINKVLKGHRYSRIKGDSIVKKLFTLLFRYNIMPVFCSNREEMARYIVEYYSGIGRKAIEDLRQGKSKRNSLPGSPFSGTTLPPISDGGEQ